MKGELLQTLSARELELGPLRNQPPATPRRWRHWRLARDPEQVLWLLFDRPEAAVNLLGEETLRELGEILAELVDDPPRALVLRSAKAAGFCAGADVGEFARLQEPDEIEAKLRAAHAVADRLAALRCPTLAILHGACLGGGLELALCCRYRLALPEARLGLPEVRLGLHPGLGGTARLTELIDPLEAMTLMLTGKTVSAARARELGLVDGLVEERQVAQAVRAMASGELAGQRSGLVDRLLSTRPARRLEARRMRAKSAEKANPEHYPAPQALIALWEEHGGEAEAMRRQEIASFARLLRSDTARNLIRVFLLRQQLKQLGTREQPPIDRLHVIGAGAMGGEIAGWCALQGVRVSLYDPEPAKVAQAVRKTAELCRAKQLSARQTREVLDRLIPDLRQRGIPGADLVLEAVPERLELKQQIFREVEPQLKPGALLATNTSSLPLEQLRAGLADPGRLVGLHFFNPVARMQLVEIVRHDAISPQTLERAQAFARQIDRLPVPVASAPGFLVNRVLLPYLLEAMLLLEEGLAAESIDRAAEDFGMPLGPLELADRVGLDICLDVAESLQQRLDQPLAPIPQRVRDLVQRGDLGRKTGRGFYRWQEGKPQQQAEPSAVGEEVLDRLLLPLLNSCMSSLRAGVVAEEDWLDAALIFGTGFAPFRGGPLHYARHRGLAEIARRLEQLAARHGERFTPDPGWSETD